METLEEMKARHQRERDREWRWTIRGFAAFSLALLVLGVLLPAEVFGYVALGLFLAVSIPLLIVIWHAL